MFLSFNLILLLTSNSSPSLYTSLRRRSVNNTTEHRTQLLFRELEAQNYYTGGSFCPGATCPHIIEVNRFDPLMEDAAQPPNENHGINNRPLDGPNGITMSKDDLEIDLVAGLPRATNSIF